MPILQHTKKLSFFLIRSFSLYTRDPTFRVEVRFVCFRSVNVGVVAAMSLFQRNSEPILFNLINLRNAERAALTELIESEGGGVTEDENVTVKFTSRDAYVRNGPLVRAKIYDVTFIEECIRQKKIVKPENYRLDKRIGQDDFYVQHFLYGKCEDARFRVQCQWEDRQEEKVRSQSAYSIDTLPDSDAYMEPATSITPESIDESPPVLTALELKAYESSLAGGDSAACYDKGEKRPCKFEYKLKIEPKETFHRIEDCAMKNVDSRLNGDPENRLESSRNWYENPNRPSHMESVTNIKQEPDDDWTNMDMPGQVAVLSIIPEARMLAHDTCVVPSTRSNNNSWSRMTLDNEESTDRETKTPDLDLVSITNNHLEAVRASDNKKEPMDKTKRKHRIEKSAEQSHTSREKLEQCRRKISENEEVNDDHERNPSTVETQGAKEAHRRLPKFRETLRDNDDSENSSIPSSEATILSQDRIEDTTSSILSEPIVISDENSGNDQPSHLCGRGDSESPGPSGVRNTRRRHDGDKLESNESTRFVRNFAHSTFLTKPIEEDDHIEEHCTAKKMLRGKVWRAKLKSQTDAQYTGTNSRIPFTPSERRTMLRYLIKNKCISRAKGLVVWKKMITDGYLTSRTPQSLQNHFRKSILPKIEDAGWLENSDMQKFLALRGDSDQT